MDAPTPIAVGYGPLTIRLLVNSAETECEILAAEFTATNSAVATGPVSPIVVHALFISFCAKRATDPATVSEVFAAFDAAYCRPVNMHIVRVVDKHGLTTEDSRTVLRGYYAGWSVSPHHLESRSRCAVLPKDALAVFGGALGCAKGAECLDIVRDLVDVYGPLVDGYLGALTEFVQREIQDSYIAHFYSHAMDVEAWIVDPKSAPAPEYLDSPPVAFLLLGLVQLLRLLVLSKTFGLSVGQLVKQLDAVAGHSHGLIIAAAVAASSPSDDASFTAASKRALGMMMLFGCLPQLVSPQPALHPLAVSECEHVEGTPSPMASVRGVSRQIVDAVLEKYNKFVKDDSEAHVFLSVVDTDTSFLISGNIKSLVQVVLNVRKRAAAVNEDQSNVPFLSRKPEVVIKFVPMASPQHCAHMAEVVDRHMAYAAEKGWSFDAAEMLVPVLSTSDGMDVRARVRDGSDITRHLLECVYVHAIDWPRTLTGSSAPCVIDFAPAPTAAADALGSLCESTCANVDGRGVAVICADMLAARSPPPAPTDGLGTACIRSLPCLFGPPACCQVDSWRDRHGPRLIRTDDATLQIDTPLHRATGLPPVIIGGVLPTTANVDFVAAASRAGYLSELSADNATTAEELVSMVVDTVTLLQAGHGVSLSCRWTMQHEWLLPCLLRMLEKMRLPIIGLSISDAVPADCLVLIEAIPKLQAAGLRFVAFRAGTVGQIRRVVDIAKQHPLVSVVLQWTGGRNGGRHSFEEFHIPILQTYSLIRAQPNVVLVAGSGFGDAESALPYLSGSWGELFERTCMPFDGIMLGSRVVCALESPAALEVKSLIAETRGIDGYDLPALFTDNAGGVVSVLDVDGVPVHVVANRAALLCKELSDTVFSQPRDKQLALLQSRSSEIAARLTADYMRPWFATRDGEPVELQDMTYAQILNRLVELMYVASERRWIHPSYRNFVSRFGERTGMRLIAASVEFVPQVPPAHYDPVLDEIDTVMRMLPTAHTQLIASEDIQFFLNMCQRPGQKPVPFVPVLDEHFADYLMLDTCWQIEDLRSVAGDDPHQRVLIRQGPVSVRHTTIPNEPLADILNGVHRGLVNGLLAEQYGGSMDRVPVAAYVGRDPADCKKLPGPAADASGFSTERTYRLSHDASLLPSDGEAWASMLCGAHKCWLHALLTAQVIVRGTQHVSNYLPQVLRPRAGRSFSVSVDESSNAPTAVTVYAENGTKELDISISDASRVALRIHHDNGLIQRSVCLEFTYNPRTPLAPIHEDVAASDENVRQFFADIWLLASDDAPAVEGLDDGEMAFVSRGIAVTSDKVAEYCRSVGIDLPAYPPNTDQATSVPMDYLSVLALPNVFRTLTAPGVYSNLLHMVQTRNVTELVSGVEPLMIGDAVDVVTRVVEVSGQDSGKTVVIRATIHRGTDQLATVHTTFVFLGASVDPLHAFRFTTEPNMVVSFKTANDIAVLESKEWFRYIDGVEERAQPECRLEFDLTSEYRLREDGTYSSVHTSGPVYLRSVFKRRVHIANVDYAESACVSNPVTAYLQPRAESAAPACSFDDGGYALSPKQLVTRAPASAHGYAVASGDHNPHNTNAYVADIAGLPAPLMHGLWSSASARKLIEKHVAGGDPTRVRQFQVSMAGMVFPDDELQTRLFHTGMRNGLMLVSGHTYRAVTGELVLKCTAEVAQPKTAYVFTGQGSQEVGMVTEICERSPAARAICERVDQHVRRRFGYSILDVIKNNPKEHTVHFGGVDGARIRRNYMQFTRRVDTPDGSKTLPLFNITPTTRSFTFHSPTGLLNSTQFAQPAIMLFDIAVVTEMRSRGVFVEDAIVAGHSLGEYGALAAFGFIFPEDIVDVTFIRGATMQSTVERDADHNSNFAMVAVNPSRVNRDFDEQCMAYVVDELRTRAGNELLEIVNYNVRQFQYVVAGTRAQLATLGAVLDALHQRKLNIRGQAGKQIASKIMDDLLAAGCGTEVKRSRATIPIPGIDVPFHSSHLLQGADQFRSCINMMVRPSDFDSTQFIGKYIPNLNAVPFDISPEFLQQLYDQTKSPVIERELAQWRPDTTLEEQLELCRYVIIELLSYQFASPVKWIQTQERMFREMGVQRLVEIGPSAILTRMAEGTLMLSGMEKQVALQHIHRDADDIFFASALENAKAEREQESERERQAQQEQLALHEAEVASVASSETAVDLDSAPPSRPSTSGGGGQCEVPDVPLTAVDVIRVVIAQKTKRALGDVPAEKSVKDLTGGKSTLQNEILGDLLKEFSSGGQIPDRPDEITLLELSTGLGAFSGTLGKYTSAQVSRLFSTKMPGGFSLSAVRSLLSSQFGLARAHQQDAVLLQALTMEPAGRFSSTDEAGQWLGTVAQAYAQVHGISLASQQSGSSGAAGAQGVAINSAEFELAQKSQRALAMRQIEAYARYLGIDLREGQRAHESAKDSMGQQQQQLDALVDELGSDFVDGIRGVFDVRKARVFDSHWNWARVDAYEWINAVLAGPAQPAEWSSADAQRLHVLANRADALLLKLASGMVRVLEQTQATAADDPCHAAAHRLACRIRDQCAAAAGGSPVYRELSQPTAPHTAISSAGKISYSEEPRAGEPSFAEYVDHVCAQPTDEARQQQHHLPLVHLREKAPTHDWVYSDDCSAVYYEALREMSAAGTSFGGCTALVTGCSRGSIAAQMLCCLLAGGAKVVATTSSYSRDALLFYEALYKQHGARGSELIVVPFNQGSVSDIRRLVAYIYGPADGAGSGRGLGWNLDYVLPFAAISEYGSDVSRLGSRSELAARIMLTNVLRLLGEIRSTKVELGYGTRQTMAVLPLSPNHGVFGNDGLYGESKAALETAFNRWESEGWGCHMSVAGAVIGWTRGTGLMSVNNTIAQAIESHGTRTFSTFEMAFNLMGLLHPAVAALAQDAPVWADLNGGLQRIARVNDAVNSARLALHSESGRRGAAVLGYGTDLGEALGPAVGQMHQDFVLNPLFNHKQQFPCAPAYEQLEHLRHLEGMVNLDQVVVVTGYGELGPYGHAETRWEMEAHGEFSLEGCVELAWVMGLIRHVNGAVPGVEPRKRQRYAGWVDAASGEPVADHEVKARYEKQILDHTGIRLLEPELLDGQDPAVVPIMRELQIEHDMEPFEASADEAAGFKLRNGDKVDSWANADGSWSVRFLKGAVLMVPKALRFDRLVGAQLPTGWDPARYGIPKDVIEQVDPVTCYALVATVEAFVRSGITDPYELYRYFHVAQVGTSLGSGAGGVFSIRDLYRNRLTDKHVQSDILQETFANTTAAWINMLLLSSSGAIKPPTGGCGTSVLSVDVAADTIRAGKARVMIAGAFEGFVDQGSYEFAQMGATSNAVDELAAGRTPREMSRPTTSTRTGFVEAQGAGVMVLMSASAALEFGAPVYAVLAYSGTATDKQGHSLPAPGMGVLTSARQAPGAKPSRALDMAYRKRQIRRAMRDADAWAAEERELASDEAASPDDLAQHLALIDAKLADMRGEALNTWGQDFWRRLPDVSPLGGSLAAWGLTADDIGMASFHGTATVANDWNESNVLNEQLRHIGRTPGVPVPAVCQKWLTGHPKGPAAAWMVNGAIQSMRTGLVPGNRNADNIDKALQHDFIVYPSRSIQTRMVKAALLKSFGFGQVGAEILLVHPDYLLATLEREQLECYRKRLGDRKSKSYRYWQDTFAGNHGFVQVKATAPYTADQEKRVYLDPRARAACDPVTGEYRF